MKRKIKALLLALMISSTASAQYQAVQNRPYTDLRTFHFGVTLGTHVQDIELKNIGPQDILYPDGTTKNSNISVEQDRWDAGFHVGVLGELRLSTHFQLRIAPTMYFGTRHLILRDELEKAAKDLQDAIMPIGAKLYQAQSAENAGEASDKAKTSRKKDNDEPVEGEVIDKK